MKPSFPYRLRSLTTLFLAMGVVMPAFSEKAGSEADRVVKTDYNFKQSVTPERFSPLNGTVFYSSGNTAYTTQGSELASQGLKITDFQMHPAGHTFLLISSTKKGPVCALFSAQDESHKLMSLNSKNYGMAATAAFSADGKDIAYATTDGNVLILDSRTLIPKDTLKISFTPNHIILSSNGYFLAAADDNNVAVYNLEGKNLRQSWNFDSKVNDITFDPEVAEFAIATDDGMVNIYDTRRFLVKREIDGMGDAIAIAYNPDSKYMAVVTSPNEVQIINQLTISPEIVVPVEKGLVSDVALLSDFSGHVLMYYPTECAIKARRLWQLSPYYGKLISEAADQHMMDYMKMMDGESLEAFQARVSENSLRQERMRYEAEIATEYASKFMVMSPVQLGKYDRSSNLLEMGFDNIPPIFLSVPEQDVANFRDAAALEFRNIKYGVLPDDSFEIVYAEIYNSLDNKTYIYDNRDRIHLSFMENENDLVSLDVIQQMQQEEMLLQELRRKVIEEAKQQDVISDHTHITVSSSANSTYDANGESIVNYNVKFNYEVEPDFVASEDFPMGKYRWDMSGAASSMLRIVKEALEGELASYVKPGKKLLVKITGSADAAPVHHAIKYDGVYGDFINEPIYTDNQLTSVTVTKKDGIPTNEALAFTRGAGVRSFLENNVASLNEMTKNYQFFVNVADEEGGQYRRITLELTFVDAF